MKIVIASDIHGSYRYVKKLMEAYQREGASEMILLGDLYYHGPRNPLTDEYNPSKVADLFNSISSSIHCVRGNCDAEVDEMISNFPFLDHYSFQFHGYHFYCTHGHVYHLGHLPDEKVDLLIYGHYHVGFIKQENGVYYVNSGSVSLPKENSAHSYLLLDDTGLFLKDLDGTVIDSVLFTS